MSIENEVKEITEKTQDILKKQLVQDVVKSNEIEFEVSGTKYRVRRPSYEQKQKVMSARTRKFVSLLKDKEQLREKDLIDLYASRGISIEDLDRQISNAQSRRNELALKIGKMLEENKTEEELQIVKKELESVILEQNKPLMEKSSYLELSIESQVNVYAYVYMGHIVTEKYVYGKDLGNGNKEPDLGWVKAWPSYEEFIKENEDVVNNVVWHTAMVAKNEIPSL